MIDRFHTIISSSYDLFQQIRMRPQGW